MKGGGLSCHRQGDETTDIVKIMQEKGELVRQLKLSEPGEAEKLEDVLHLEGLNRASGIVE